MSIRFDVRDLPPRRPPGDGAVYELTWRIEQRRHSHPLPEGETSVGASARCDIRVQAAGVRGRHVRIKRNGDAVYVQGLGGSKVLVDGEAIEGLTALAHGRAFTFGSVSAVVERVAPKDREAAVSLSRIAPPSIVEEGETQAPDSAVRQLGLLNDALERLLRSDGPAAADLLLETLRRCLAPAAAALFRRRAGREWGVLAELAEPGASIPGPEAGEGYARHSLVSGGEELLLVVSASDEGHPAWQREVCRHLLALASLSVSGRGSGARAPAGAGEGQVWEEFVGSRVRSHLDASSEMCRYSDSVLVLGETGTGKELVARGLHRLWGRTGALVAINCAAIPGELLDAELFGIEAGAATGVAARRGRFEQAEGGTLFLDEVSELPLQLQTKLLRVLQEREFFSVGGTKLRQADVKIVGSSNRSADELRAGLMRPDLYFRLGQAVVSLPPLRERTQDLAALCEHFLGGMERQYGRGVAGLSVAALDRLKGYAWPGNVRELQNLLRFAYASAPRDGLVQSAHLPAEMQSMPKVPDQGALAAVVAAVERQVIERELERQGSVARAAESLGLSEGYLYRKIKALGLGRGPRSG